MQTDQHEDPFHPHNNAKVRPIDVLAFALGIRKMNGDKLEAGDTPEANFTKEEIALAHRVVAETNHADEQLGIQVVGDNEVDGLRIPRSYHMLYKGMMFSFLSEGERATRRLLWYKAGFWILAALQVFDLLATYVFRAR